MGSNLKFEQIAGKLKRLPKNQYTILGLDPGETVGWCRCKTAVNEYMPFKFSCGQEKVGSIEEGALWLRDMLPSEGPLIVVMEDYFVYGWKADEHSWAKLFTPQLIGAFKGVLAVKGRGEPFMQKAVEAKPFCTDDKLEQWGLYQKGQRHARDAIRHVCYWILFNKDVPSFFS